MGTLHDSIAIIATIVNTMCLLLALRFYKYIKFEIIFVFAVFSATSISYHFLCPFHSDILYDFALILASLILLRNSFKCKATKCSMN
jgi:hypothetical protein